MEQDRKDLLEVLRDNFKLIITAELLSSQYYIDIPFIDSILDQIIFELIAEDYIKNNSGMRKSLTKHNGVGDEIAIKKDARTMQYSNYYRKETAKRLNTAYGFTSPELEVENLKVENGFNKPYQLNDYEHLQIKTMENLKLLKLIVNRQVIDIKSVAATRLEDKYLGYIDYFKLIFQDGDDDAFVRNAILLFTTETKYQVMSVYALADKLSQYNNSKSKNKFSESVIEETALLFRMTDFIYNTTMYHKENNLILPKLQTIGRLTPTNYKKEMNSFQRVLQLCAITKHRLKQSEEFISIVQQSTAAQRKAFINNHYPIQTILDKKLTWESKKTKYIRSIFDAITLEIQPPKVK